MEEMIADLLKKAEEVSNIIQSYSTEITELEDLVSKGQNEYQELVEHYKEKLKELSPQLTQIRHAVFKLREAKRFTAEADALVTQIRENFDLDIKKKESISRKSLEPAAPIVFSGKKKVRF